MKKIRNTIIGLLNIIRFCVRLVRRLARVTKEEFANSKKSNNNQSNKRYSERNTHGFPRFCDMSK